MTKRIFYEKQGRRYKPVSEYDSDLLSALPRGAHLVMVYPGGRSTRYNVIPALAPMIAAGRLAERAVAESIVEASSMRPSRKAVTPEQQLAWQNMARAFGADTYSIQIPSASEIAQAGTEAMIKEAERLLTNPAVKAAYDQFMFVCELARNQDDIQS